jgi:DNA recombination protein RmuC
MQTILLIILTLLALGLVAVVLYLLQQLKASQNTPEPQKDMFLMLQQQMQEMSKVMDQKLGESSRSMYETKEHLHQTIQRQFGHTTKVISDITEKLTSLDKTNQQVIGFREQLNNLEKVLTHQKNRGSLGEAGLHLVLENILPPTAYELQYKFDDGDTVDAIVKTKDGLIPVDAKFSLDNYQRILDAVDDEQKAKLEKDFKNDLKKRIDETAKYIKPKFGTMEFAFMFIPAEAIYYDLLVNEVGAVKVNTQNLVDYAFRERKVIIVSPTTFAAYLQTVLQGLRALKIEEGAKEIQKNVEKLGKHIAAYDEYYKKLGNSLQTTVNHYNTGYKELNKIDKDVMKITGGEKLLAVEEVDTPMLEQ